MKELGQLELGQFISFLKKILACAEELIQKNIFTGKGVNGQTWFQMDILEFLRATQLKYT